MMKKLMMVMLVLMMLCGCSGGSSGDGSVVVLKPTDGTSETEKTYTLDDGIIPYLSHSPINLEYDVIVKEDQQYDYTINKIVKLTPLKKEGEMYETLKDPIDGMEGELFIVSEVHDGSNGVKVWHSYYDQMDPDESNGYRFWAMKDDPSARVLTIDEYSTSRMWNYDSEKQEYVPGALHLSISDGNKYYVTRYTVDYSAMNDDDWKITVIEDVAHNEIYPHVGKNEGYMTVYDPVGEIEEFTLMRVTETGVRIRSTPQIRDDNKLGSLHAYSEEFTFAFFVYEIKDDGTYTWYRVGKKRWIADDGTWVELILPEKTDAE